MIMLKKTITDITTAYGEFKHVLDRHDLISSMELYLQPRNRSCWCPDIVLCDHNNISADRYNSTNTIPNSYIEKCNNTASDLKQAINNILPEDACRTGSKDIAIETATANFASYDDFVAWALDTCKTAHATPFDPTRNGYTMMIGPNNFHIGKPNDLSVSIAVYGENNTITYDLQICYGGRDVYDEVFFKNSEMYKRAIEYGWTVA